MKLLKFMKKQFLDKDIRYIIIYFFIWRISLLLIAILAAIFIPLRGRDFFGGGIENYLNAPWFFGWANFDGEHYLSITQFGYRSLEQAFFPIYPVLMHSLSIPLGANFVSLISSGLLISNLSFVVSLIVLWKLIQIDYQKEISWLAIFAILIFPTAFYFGAVYSESIFLLLSLLSFYFARKKRWFLSGVFGAISSATRVFGILLLPALLIEAWQQRQPLNKFFWIFMIPFGLLGYMYYQWTTVGDPIAFYNLQKIIGPQHDEGITLLPQIYFRYIKILFTTPISNPVFQTVLLELFIGVLFFILPIYGFFKKMRYSFVFYALVGFLLPSIQGSFSSAPRYVLVLFPSFIAMAIFLSNLKKSVMLVILTLLFIWLVIETALFIRGYWVA